MDNFHKKYPDIDVTNQRALGLSKSFAEAGLFCVKVI
jgi:hypothetical protein